MDGEGSSFPDKGWIGGDRPSAKTKRRNRKKWKRGWNPIGVEGTRAGDRSPFS